ncbi:phosphate ABC transporter substrate-binding protein PstS [Ideonella sp. DXS29W]|uniref:Phosphate-binding protein PstS n=1 Tax=Ideonella lacteola TaxID=2984193 RepID=A0ABU9BW66_9BURK
MSVLFLPRHCRPWAGGLVLCLLGLVGPCGAQTAPVAPLSGAGSSAAAPIYSAWGREYAKLRGDSLDYAPIGSSAGMAKIRAGEVDFGSSDVIAPRQELERDGLVMFPTAVTGVVPVVNLPRVAPRALRLSGEVLARIFLGDITQWDAAPIQMLNPELKLPALPIRRIVRADGSGTTYHFGDYLGRVHAAWKQRHPAATKLEWAGEVTAVKGSAEMAKAVRATAGAIGYVDYNYVVSEGLVDVSLKNADGHFVAAGVDSFREAVMNSAWFREGDFFATINDVPGTRTWPITMGTYMALPRVPKSRERAERTLSFIVWAYLRGDALAREARFVPLPAKVQASAYREISKVSTGSGELLGVKVMNSLLTK